jgi:hypothetical protein
VLSVKRGLLKREEGWQVVALLSIYLSWPQASLKRAFKINPLLPLSDTDTS